MGKTNSNTKSFKLDQTDCRPVGLITFKTNGNDRVNKLLEDVKARLISKLGKELCAITGLVNNQFMFTSEDDLPITTLETINAFKQEYPNRNDWEHVLEKKQDEFNELLKPM